MKKIRTLHQLQEEKLRLRVQQLELEHDLRTDWKDIKESVQPKHLFSHAFTSGEDKKTAFGGWLVNGLHMASQSLTDQVFQKAEASAGAGINRLMDRVQAILNKKRKK